MEFVDRTSQAIIHTVKGPMGEGDMFAISESDREAQRLSRISTIWPISL